MRQPKDWQQLKISQLREYFFVLVEGSRKHLYQQLVATHSRVVSGVNVAALGMRCEELCEVYAVWPCVGGKSTCCRSEPTTVHFQGLFWP